MSGISLTLILLFPVNVDPPQSTGKESFGKVTETVGLLGVYYVQINELNAYSQTECLALAQIVH